MIQGHTDIVWTLPLLFLMTVIFMTDSLCARRARNAEWVTRIRYRRLSMTTSTSQGRSVPFFLSLGVFLLFT